MDLRLFSDEENPPPAAASTRVASPRDGMPNVEGL
jgi:hypothetical protein